MFQFGLFSSHLPYIFTVVAYLLSYGFYAFGKSDVEAAKPQESTISVVDSRVTPPQRILAYDATHHFTVQQQAAEPIWYDAPIYGCTISHNVHCPPNLSVATRVVAYALYSRPPTFC